MTYFERPLTIAVIFGSFFLVFLLLFALPLWPSFVGALRYIALAHAVGLGTSHFFVTLAILSYVRCFERHGDRAGRALWIALAYFVMQGFCAALAVLDTRFYLAALTLHYVEYHVLYLAPWSSTGPRARAGSRMVPALTSVALALAGVTIGVQTGAFHRLGDSVEQRKIRSMRADGPVRWAASLLQRGEPTAARAPLLHALRDDPSSSQAKSPLEVAQRALGQAAQEP